MKFSYRGTSLVEDEEFAEEGKRLSPYIKQIAERFEEGGYEYPESSIALPADDELLLRVERVVEEKRTDTLKYIFVIGIGGSNLGTKAVYDALLGYKDMYEPHRYPRMFFLDTNDPEITSSIVSFMRESVSDLSEIALVAVSKSGATTETAVNLEVVFDALTKRFSIENIFSRLIAITDEESSFAKEARARGIATLSIPHLVGGRYSVFSAVGLVPLALCGIDIEELRAGAQDVYPDMKTWALSENRVAQSALALYCNHKKGKDISVHFIFHPELSSLGAWYMQLVGESLGKEVNTKGKKVHTGVTPLVSIGSTDLHSLGQLYLGGPRDKVTTFISSEAHEGVSVPSETVFDVVSGIQGKSLDTIMHAIVEGVERAYEKKHLAYMDMVLPDTSERSLGAFLQFKMLEVMYVGYLFDVNPFDQPSVESYKEETRKLLEENI